MGRNAPALLAEPRSIHSAARPPYATPAMRTRCQPDEIECATDAGADRPRRKDSGPEQRTQLHSPEVTHANVSARPCATVVVYRTAFRSRAPVRPSALSGRIPFAPLRSPRRTHWPTRSHPVHPAARFSPRRAPRSYAVASRSPLRSPRSAPRPYQGRIPFASPRFSSRRALAPMPRLAAPPLGPTRSRPWNVDRRLSRPRTFDRRPPCSPQTTTAAPCRPIARRVPLPAASHRPPRPIARRDPSTVATRRPSRPRTTRPRTSPAPPAPSPRPSHRHRTQRTRTAQRRDRAVGI